MGLATLGRRTIRRDYLKIQARHIPHNDFFQIPAPHKIPVNRRILR